MTIQLFWIENFDIWPVISMMYLKAMKIYYGKFISFETWAWPLLTLGRSAFFFLFTHICSDGIFFSFALTGRHCNILTNGQLKTKHLPLTLQCCSHLPTSMDFESICNHRTVAVFFEHTSWICFNKITQVNISIIDSSRCVICNLVVVFFTQRNFRLQFRCREV